MNVRVRLSAWPSGGPELSCSAVTLVPQPPHTERARWPAKPPVSSWTLTNSSTSSVWSVPPLPPRPSPFVPASCSAASASTHRPMNRSRPNCSAPATPSPSGAVAAIASAWLGWLTSPAAAARPLFPPEERHQVVVLATTPPADVGVPASHWSLDDLAYHILKDAHYRDMSRSTRQRILAEADLQPHRCRSWRQSHDSDFAAKALDSCDLYLRA